MFKDEKNQDRKKEKSMCNTSIIAYATSIFNLMIAVINLIEKIMN